MNWDDFRTDQKEVITAQDRRIVVFGGAGSGKTTVALWRARHFLESQEAKPWHRVLFLTFSRTAVREIARRSGRELATVRGRLEIHTFHAFANRLITAFGRFAGLGRDLPPFRSDAEAKLLGSSTKHLSYDDLLPRALDVIKTPTIKRIIEQRWPLIICDEFLDTDDRQWELLCELSKGGARLLTLADPNQMIYAGFLGDRGVGPNRVQLAVAASNLLIDLGAPSHRDSSNVIPAMAVAVRRRDFQHPAVRAAVNQDKLRVHRAVRDDGLIEILMQEIESALSEGCRSIGIFGHGNQGVADMSMSLFDGGVEHALVGLPEAHGEALATMEAACRYGAGHESVNAVRLRLAVFLTASVRGRSVPELATGLRGSVALPSALNQRLNNALADLREKGEANHSLLIGTAMEFWPSLKITSGNRSWAQAARSFGAIAEKTLRRAGSSSSFFVELARQISSQRADALFNLDIANGHAIQLMNFHQTKGREFDVAILVYRDNDWFGREVEPFPNNSRLLYVSLTRARKRNVLILPFSPHGLVAPFQHLVDNE